MILRWLKSPFILLIKSLSSGPTSSRSLFWQPPAQSRNRLITWNITDPTHREIIFVYYCFTIMMCMHAAIQGARHMDTHRWQHTHTNRFTGNKIQLNWHLLTASVRACWQGEDPCSGPCKAVRRPGGVMHAEENTHTHTHGERMRAHHWIIKASESRSALTGSNDAAYSLFNRL